MTPDSLARLLAWLSPAFPTGSFAYSHALEWAVQSGDVRDQNSLVDWLSDLLRHGSLRNDAILCRHAHAAASTPRALTELAELALALQPSRERQLEARAQGMAFLAAASPWGSDRIIVEHDLAYPVAVGALAGLHAIAADATAIALLQAVVATLISACVRLVPLGQSAGVAALAALETAVLTAAAESANVGVDDIGGACFRSDIASMRHETQYTRLFRS